MAHASGSRSWVHPPAVAEVEADRLHHLERRALGEDVGGREHARVLLDHGCGCGPGEFVQAALERVSRVQGRSGRDGRYRSRARDREVHRGARGRGRLHREHDVPGDAVDPPRPRLRIVGAPMIRDPLGDHLLTPQNAALLVIDYQPSQIAAVQSMDRTWC